MISLTRFLHEQEDSFNFLKDKNTDHSQSNIYGDEKEGTQKNVDSKDDSDHNKDSDKDDTKDKKTKKEDPNKQGLIRRIPKAHLVYKRKISDGTFEELWMYNIEKGIKDELDIRSAILSGTDVDPKIGASQGGKQRYILWTSNNVQMLQVSGLPS
jgi:hypothetical protein